MYSSGYEIPAMVNGDLTNPDCTNFGITGNQKDPMFTGQRVDWPDSQNPNTTWYDVVMGRNDTYSFGPVDVPDGDTAVGYQVQYYVAVDSNPDWKYLPGTPTSCMNGQKCALSSGTQLVCPSFYIVFPYGPPSGTQLTRFCWDGSGIWMGFNSTFVGVGSPVLAPIGTLPEKSANAHQY
jgi:hypothetical protein